MFISIAQMEPLLFEEMAHRVTWSQYVNWNGGQGKNIACDMAQEICNRVNKDVVRGMGPNKTTKAMVRASKAASGIHKIVSAMNDTLKIHEGSKKQSKKSSNEDEMSMLQDLRKLKPFERVPGRHHVNFPDIMASPTHSVNMSDLFLWLQKHKKQIGMGMGK
jgi:hypothetical protein